MAGTKIKNPETQLPKTPQMNDRDFINDCLMTEKYLTSAYAVAVHEMSHQDLYRDVLSIYEETENVSASCIILCLKKAGTDWKPKIPKNSRKLTSNFSSTKLNSFRMEPYNNLFKGQQEGAHRGTFYFFGL